MKEGGYQMNPVIVRNVRLGEGIPKICVPIVGITEEEIINEAKEIRGLEADIVEWRADWYEDVFDSDKVIQVLEKIRYELGDKPILFTFRTAKEGGERAIADLQYLDLNKKVADSKQADLIDVEIFSEESCVKAIIEYAHQNHVYIIASNHDFEKTPAQEEIVARLTKMQEMGADVLKIAVMPQTKRDVITLLAATEEMVTNYARQPVVTMSMSGQGLVSRLSGEIFGSAMTFGAAKKISAPGQIPVKELEKVLNILHQSL